MIRIKKKAGFTLIEVLISISLMALILTSLGYFFNEVNHLNRISEGLKQENFKLRYVEDRLMTVLPKSTAPNDPLKDFYFFTSSSTDGQFKPGSQSLIFTFDNGVNLVNPDFSNHVIGRLYLDKEGALNLTVLPSISRWKNEEGVSARREVLLENVEELNFEFFVPPDRERSFFQESQQLPPGLVQEEIEQKGRWINEWRYGYYQLPALVKIHLKIQTRDGLKTKTLIFPLINSTKYIVYEK